MLIHLSIQSLAVIESLEIDFTEGLNVITGETGAGKSILIKALGLLLGAKASPEAVRKGAEEAMICGSFELPATHPAIQALSGLGIGFEEADGYAGLLIRRKINAKGRSQAWVNDIAVTSTSLKLVGDHLIDIFAQHENQKLLDGNQHIDYVDAFLKNKQLLVEYETSFAACQDIYASLRAHVDAVVTNLRDRDYLQFRLSELSEFGPSPDDYEKTKAFSLNAANFMNNRTTLQAIQTLIDEGAGGEALSRPLHEVSRLFSALAKGSASLEALSQRADELAANIDDLSYEVSLLNKGGDFDEQDVEASEQRIAGYQELFRKFNVSDAASLMSEFERVEGELSRLDSAAQDIAVMLANLVKETETATSLASRLSAERKKAAKQIKASIEKELSELAMPGARIEVEFSDVERALTAVNLASFGDACLSLYETACSALTGLAPGGAERAQFRFSANKGEEMYALHKIASGGEVSRIMLAFKRTLAAGADSCLLVFDEIDSGISGKVADIVGAKLKDLSKRFQVLCISHLAQVAAYADSHYVVKKLGKKDRTESQIVRLNKQESLEELARLLSGTEITKQSLANAKALVAKFEMPKKTKQSSLQR